jgi:hypothetical protein
MVMRVLTKEIQFNLTLVKSRGSDYSGEEDIINLRQ